MRIGIRVKTTKARVAARLGEVEMEGNGQPPVFAGNMGHSNNPPAPGRRQLGNNYAITRARACRLRCQMEKPFRIQILQPVNLCLRLLT
jgi:hypothetical protein